MKLSSQEKFHALLHWITDRPTEQGRFVRLLEEGTELMKIDSRGLPVGRGWARRAITHAIEQMWKKEMME
tara:strand:+ start:433 stop:642 length:210 start_codon:yes stop_codon:yes gene_type:complete